jgi:site-specific DNA recombinase
MRTLIYTRVSTKEQVDEGNSLPTQEKICRRYAENNGMKVVGMFREEGESAKTVHRTQLKKLMEYCTVNKKSVDAILIYRIDRLSRETADYLQLKSFFAALGIKVVSASENIEDTPVGRFIENVLAGTAQFDNEVRAERSKNGMVDGVKEGRWQWKAPFGFINTRVEGKKNIAPTEDTHKLNLIREAWSLIDNGYSETEALKMVTAKGLLNDRQKPIQIQHFSKMLQNTLYMGVIEAFGLTIYSSSIKPIIDEETWHRVNDRITGKNKAPAKYKKLNPDFPLRGSLLCEYGHRMTGSAPKGNGGRYPKYHCPTCRGKGNS